MRNCPVCGAGEDLATVFQNENINQSQISEFSYASRKSPEFMCHRLVRCRSCDLVYAPEPPSQDQLAEAYHEAHYDSSEEAVDAADAYVRAMRSVIERLPQRDNVLEIGSGTGVLLERLQPFGFTKLVGVEPSTAAIEAAPAHRRQWLREGIFREGDFEPASFDLITCFMTLEHVRDPRETAEAALRLLKPGGAFVSVTHDYRSLVNRLLGARSPIIDIEHMQLFSNRSIRELLTRSGYDRVSASPFPNTYSVKYWTRLSPLPRPVKNGLDQLLDRFGLQKKKLSLNVGNTMASSFRPAG